MIMEIDKTKERLDTYQPIEILFEMLGINDITPDNKEWVIKSLSRNNQRPTRKKRRLLGQAIRQLEISSEGATHITDDLKRIELYKHIISRSSERLQKKNKRGIRKEDYKDMEIDIKSGMFFNPESLETLI